MDKIEKSLNKLSVEEREKLKDILVQIDKKIFQNLDLKKLKNRDNIFRVRKGSMRIIFQMNNSSIKILSIERRGNKTYKKY